MHSAPTLFVGKIPSSSRIVVKELGFYSKGDHRCGSVKTAMNHGLFI